MELIVVAVIGLIGYGIYRLIRWQVKGFFANHEYVGGSWWSGYGQLIYTDPDTKLQYIVVESSDQEGNTTSRYMLPRMGPDGKQMVKQVAPQQVAPQPVAPEAKPVETGPMVDNKSMSFMLFGGAAVFLAFIIYGIASTSPPSPTQAQIQANAIAEFKREHPKPQFTGTGDIMPENSLANPESPIHQLYSRENRNSPLVRHDQHDDLPEWARPPH